MLHGRAAEQGEIDRLLAAARTGRSGALVLTGEAGIGKSALLGYAAGRAPGWPVLRTVGVESEAELPFSALHLLLGPVLDHVAKLPAAQAAALTGAIGPAPDPVGDRFLVGLAALTLLSDLGPILCLADDAHWLDRGTADALLFAARRLNAEGIVMIFAGRSGVAAPGVRELALDGLADDAAEMLLAERAADLAPQVRRRVIEEAAGNPLALLELPAALTPGQRSGRLSPLPSLVDAGPPSDRVRQVFHAQIARLPDQAGAALLVAAADDTGDLALVLRACARTGGTAAGLEAAERANLIQIEASGLTFRHPLIRTAAYRSGTYFQRIAAHLALAEELSGPAHADRRAWHRAAAATGPDEGVADELERTAERARERQATVAASAAYERAAELTADACRTASRLIAAAELAVDVGQVRRAAALAERATPPAAPSAGGALARARLARVRAAVEFERGHPSDAGRVLLEGARCAAAPDPALAAQMLADSIRHAAYGGDRDLAREADAMLRALALPPDPKVRTLARGMGVVARLIEGQAVGDLSAIRATIEMAGAWAPPALATSLSLMIGEERAAHRHACAMVAHCREHGLAGLLPEALTLLAQVQMLRGRHEEASAAAIEALAIAGDIRQAHRAGQLTGALAWLAAVAGDEERCKEFAARSCEDVKAGQAMAAWALGLSELGQGRAGSALGHLLSIEHTFIALFSAPDLVEATVLADRTDLAQEPVRRLAYWAQATGRPRARALLARGRGLLSRGEEAGRHFAQAVQLDDQPFEQGRSELLYGKWLRRQRRTEARVHLRAALERFEQLGAAPWVAQAHAELLATGAARAVRGVGPLERLTPQERQVVRLAATGLSNREIGARLFLSPRTVGHHLYKAYPKLGVTSRAELAGLIT